MKNQFKDPLTMTCLAQLARHWTPKPVIISCIRLSPTVGDFLIFGSLDESQITLQSHAFSIVLSSPLTVDTASDQRFKVKNLKFCG